MRENVNAMPWYKVGAAVEYNSNIERSVGHLTSISSTEFKIRSHYLFSSFTREYFYGNKIL